MWYNSSMGMSKYITLGQGWQHNFAQDFERVSGLKAKHMGYTDSSTTTYTFMVRTKKTALQIQELCWDKMGMGWCKVDETDPREIKDRWAY